ncbi:hypothetical protein E4U28_001773 [Claviceps purpurea]|nr:hypothetical protein E4U28_001773 [Claviceps purpurea]
MWTVAEAGESTGSIAKEAQQRWLVGLAWHELRRPSHRGGHLFRDGDCAKRGSSQRKQRHQMGQCLFFVTWILS